MSMGRLLRFILNVIFSETPTGFLVYFLRKKVSGVTSILLAPYAKRALPHGQFAPVFDKDIPLH